MLFLMGENGIILKDQKEKNYLFARYIKKNKIENSKGVMKTLGEYFGDVDESANSNNKWSVALQKLIKYRNYLKTRYYDSHYLVLIGGDYDNPNSAFFAIFYNDILNQLKHNCEIEKEKAGDILDDIRK